MENKAKVVIQNHVYSSEDEDDSFLEDMYMEDESYEDEISRISKRSRPGMKFPYKGTKHYPGQELHAKSDRAYLKRKLERLLAEQESKKHMSRHDPQKILLDAAKPGSSGYYHKHRLIDVSKTRPHDSRDENEHLKRALQSANERIRKLEADVAGLRQLCANFIRKDELSSVFQVMTHDVPDPLRKAENEVLKYMTKSDLELSKQIKSYPHMVSFMSTILFPETKTSDVKMLELDQEKVEAMCAFVEAYSSYTSGDMNTYSRSRVRQTLSRSLSNKKQFRRRKAEGLYQKGKKKSSVVAADQPGTSAGPDQMLNSNDGSLRDGSDDDNGSSSYGDSPHPANYLQATLVSDTEDFLSDL